jgi:hypothetical protein
MKSDYIKYIEQKRLKWLFLVLGIGIGIIITTEHIREPLQDIQYQVEKLNKLADSLDKAIDFKKNISKEQDSINAKEKLIKYGRRIGR